MGSEICPQQCSHSCAECPQCGDTEGPRTGGALNRNLPILCEHANECPNVCPCPPDCYCKFHTCAGLALQGLIMTRSQTNVLEPEAPLVTEIPARSRFDLLELDGLPELPKAPEPIRLYEFED